MNPVLTALTVLADKPSQTGPEFGKASPIGLLIVVLLLIATCALVWSMNRHLKKLPETFDPEADPVAVEAALAEPKQTDGAQDGEPTSDGTGKLTG